MSKIASVLKAFSPIASIFSKPSQPQLPPIPQSSVLSSVNQGLNTKLPQRSDPLVQSAGRRASEAEKIRKGRQSTILSGAKGITDPLGNVSRPEARSTVLG